MANDYMAKLAADLEGMSMMREPEPMPIIYRQDGGDFGGFGDFGDDFGDYGPGGASDAGTGGGGASGGDTGEDGPEVDWASGWGESDPGGPTKEQAQEAADQMETFDTGVEVARNRNIDVTQDFMQRLSNSIEGRTQNQEGENIGLTRDEIANLSFYTDNPNDSRFGSYLGYNDLVDVNASKSINEDNARKDIEYTDRLSQGFKEKGLDATIAPDPKNPGNYVYSGKDATQAFLGELTGSIGNLVGGFGSMMLDATQMTPTGLVTGALFGRDLLAPQFFEGKSVPGPGKYIGEKFGLVDEEGKAPLEGLYNSITGSIKDALGFGTKDSADKISVSKDGTVTSASKEGKDISLSGVPSPTDVIDNILNQDAMMTPDSPEAYFGTSPQTGLPTNEEFLDMTSGDVPAYTVADYDDPAQRAGLSDTPKFGDIRDGYNMVLQDNIQNDPAFREGRTAPDYQALANERRDDYLSTLDLNTASTLVDPAIQSTAFTNQPDRFDDPGGIEPIVRRKPRPVVSQAIDDVVEEDKPYFPTASLPRLTEGGLKTLQYVYRNDPETLQNIYNKYALPEQYSGLKALV